MGNRPNAARNGVPAPACAHLSCFLLWVECAFGLLGLIGIVGSASRGSPTGVLVGALLIWPTLSFLAAPYNSLSAQQAALPADLRERRRTEYLRYGKRRLTFAVGGLGLAGGAAALALGLFVPGPANITAPQIVGPAKGQPVHYGAAKQSAPSPSRTPHKPKQKQHPTTTTTSTSTTSSTSTTPTSTSSTTAPTTSTTSTTPSTTSSTTPSATSSTTSTTP